MHLNFITFLLIEESRPCSPGVPDPGRFAGTGIETLTFDPQIRWSLAELVPQAHTKFGDNPTTAKVVIGLTGFF